MAIDVRSYTNNFNRGEVSPLSLARDDIERLSSSSSLMTNLMPIRLGAMKYRPGMEFLAATAGEAYFVEFVAATDDTALLEFTNNLMRVWVDDALIVRVTVTSTIVNGSFASNITSWTDNDDSGATSAHTADSSGAMSLIGTGTASASRFQTIGATDTGTEHTIRIVVIEAAVLFELGTSGANSDDLFSGNLGPGTHSLVFTPGANITMTFSSSANLRALVGDVSFETTGTFTIPTSVPAASLPSIRYSQSADVVFIAWDNGQQFKVERRGIKSWSIADYETNDGPFGLINNTDTTLTAAALSGVTTLTSSKDYFVSTDVGMLFRLRSAGQEVTATVTAEDTGTGTIRVTGVDNSRQFQISVTSLNGTSSTITLQRSTDDSTFTDVESYTTDQAKPFKDGFDNAILFYRLFCKTGDYVAGTIALALTYDGGSKEGTARVTGFTSATVVDVNVLTPFGRTDATREWFRGSWNVTDKFPTAVGLTEGRLWWAGRTKIWGSVSDSFFSFDDSIEGDSQPIQKTIGFGPVDSVEWMLGLNRLLLGLASDVIPIRSNSFGVALTQSTSNIKSGFSQGAAPRQPIQINSRGYYVHRSLERIYELEYSDTQDGHEGPDLMVLNPEICSAGIKRIAFTTQPETRIYVVLNDGSARVYLMDKSENVKAWSRIETDGNFEDVVVLPATGEDRVYFVVNRTAGRYLEKFALFSESVGGVTSKTFDSFVTYTSPGTTITGLSHIEGKTVGVWADSQYRVSRTVSGGQITVPTAWTNVVVGLRYLGDYTTSKIGQFTDRTVLTYDKRIVQVGFILKDYWPKSIKVGRDSSNLDEFPDIEDGNSVVLTATQSEYDQRGFGFNGDMETDPRIHLQVDNPATILLMSYTVDESNDLTPKEG